MMINTGKIMMGLAAFFSGTTVLAAGWSGWLGLLFATWIVILYVYLRHIEHRQTQELLFKKAEDFANKLMEDLQKESLDDYASKN